MPSILCRCGEKINYGEVPCPHELLVISDVDFDKFSGKVNSEDIYMEMKHAIKCPACKTLWLYENGFSFYPVEYLLVDGIQSVNS